VRAVVQRALRASVAVEGETVGELATPGLCVFVGVTHADTSAAAARLAGRLWHLRILRDDEGRMNRSAADTGAPFLVVSQFTLYGDATRGRRPSFVDAAPGPVAEPLVEHVVDELRALGATVATGRFGAEMLVEIANDGPVTLVVDV
jgi:D-tyrosyl-tRNA(Tyr) deacylase